MLSVDFFSGSGSVVDGVEGVDGVVVLTVTVLEPLLISEALMSLTEPPSITVPDVGFREIDVEPEVNDEDTENVRTM